MNLVKWPARQESPRGSLVRVPNQFLEGHGFKSQDKWDASPLQGYQALSLPIPFCLPEWREAL